MDNLHDAILAFSLVGEELGGDAKASTISLDANTAPPYEP